MDKRTWFVIAAICGVLALPCGGWAAYNLLAVKHTFSSSGTPDTWSVIWTSLSALFTGGLTVSGVISVLVALLKQGVDKVAPNASPDAKAQAVDTAQIVAIRGALAIVKDPTTRTSLIAAGRAAFDDLKDRTFAMPVVEVTQ